MDNTNKKKRLAIYCFYDPEGIVDRYITFFLKALSEIAERIIVVVNGTLASSGQVLFSEFSKEIIIRENEGLDFGAYKAAIKQIGWENLVQYDEVILCNDSVMGPIYPFQEMFDEMDQRGELDFWGITRHMRLNQNLGGNPYGYIPEHIQSYFTVYRNRFLKSRELQEYWENLPAFYSYTEAIGKHETFFTKHFSDIGFRWDTYVDNSTEADFSEYLLITAPQKALSKYRCPVFKRKTFFQEHEFNLCSTVGEAASELLTFLQSKTSYDTDMIFENIIRTCNLSDIVYNLGLFYVLPKDATMGNAFTDTEHKKCALIMHICCLDIIEETLHYATAMPKDSDIYITTPFEQWKSEIENSFSGLENRVFVRIVENRGREVSALLVGCADVIKNYNYICFWNDKKSKQVGPESVGYSWSYKLSNSVLASEIFVRNVLSLFDENPFLGFLTPLPPNHNVYFNPEDGKWEELFEDTKALAEKLSIHVPISRNKHPIMPFGSVFWFRGKAFQPLMKYDWKYMDFPDEPNAIDGILLYAIERIYGYAVQSAGYLSAYLTSDKIAAFELAAYMRYWREYQELGKIGHVWGTALAVREALEYRLNYVNLLEKQVQNLSQEINRLIPQTSLKTQLRIHFKRWLPNWLYSVIVWLKQCLM